MLLITSAGCNALDYALTGPKQVIAVDINPRQNALLELKLAGIKHCGFEDFFPMFGRGRLDRAGRSTADKLRAPLSPWAQQYWDRHIAFFDAASRLVLFSWHFGGVCPVHQFLHRSRGPPAAVGSMPLLAARPSKSSARFTTSTCTSNFGRGA